MKASSEDEAALVYPLPDGIFGWIAQQAVEKLYKALLSAHGRAYPFTHDLLLLRSLVDAQGERLPAFAFPLQDLSEYAGQFRYEEAMPLDERQREDMRADIGTLRTYCLKRIQELGSTP